MLFTVFKLRHQAAGVLHGKIYASADAAEADAPRVRKALDKAHGTHHAKTDEPLWLVVVEEQQESDQPMPGFEAVPPPPPPPEVLELTDADGKAYRVRTEHAELVEDETPKRHGNARGGKGRSILDDTEASGTGTVVNPGEPGYVAPPKREGESFTITAEDVGTLKR